MNSSPLNTQEGSTKDKRNEVFYKYFLKKQNNKGQTRLQCKQKTKDDKICNVEVHYKKHNAKRHLESAHRQLYAELVKQIDKNSDNLLGDDMTYYSAKPVKTTISQFEFDLLIVERTVKSGRPLQDFNDEAFRTLIKPYCDALGVTVNDEYAKKNVFSTHTKLIQVVSSKLKKVPFHILMDGSTRHKYDYISTAVRFYDKEYERPEIIYLGMIPSRESQTGEYVAGVVDHVLEKYGLEKWQVVSTTVDNGANYIKASKIILQEAAQSRAQGKFLNKLNFNLRKMPKIFRHVSHLYSHTGTLIFPTIFYLNILILYTFFQYTLS